MVKIVISKDEKEYWPLEILADYVSETASLDQVFNLDVSLKKAMQLKEFMEKSNNDLRITIWTIEEPEEENKGAE
jgi:hypothetical protein